MQGSGNLYTALDKRFFVPDPDLGWRISTQHPIWLGLEVCAVIAAIAVGLALGGWFIARRERATGARAKWLRIASWSIAVAPLVVPIVAFVSGAGPEGGRDVLPARDAARIETGIAGALALPAGTYEVVAHRGSSVLARISAGGEAFDAVFNGELRGSWRGDPNDLSRPLAGEISVAAASVDTGIEMRSKHAREDYLAAAKHPRITWKLERLIAARQEGPSQLVFRAAGTLELIGKTHAVEVIGSLKQPDAAALERLGLTGAILVVDADFSIAIHETALASDAKDFDGDRIPVHVSLVLRHTGG